MFSTKTTYFIIICFISCYGRTYRQFSLLLGVPLTQRELDFFTNLTKNYDVTFWKEPTTLYMPLHFSIGPRELAKFYQDAKNNQISLAVILQDVQSEFDQQSVASYTRRMISTFDWSSYYDLHSIYQWLSDLDRKHKEMNVRTIGRTFESRDILAVKLIIGRDTNATRPKVMIEGGIHAREWISPAFVTYMIKTLLDAPMSNNTELKAIAKNYEFHFIPVANPDGYEYSHKFDRMWKKNRRNSHGVDLNRNFGLAFGEIGEEKFNKYSEGYCGEAPFSELESSAIAKYIKSNKENLKYYISFHSYGQHFIIPYAYTKEHLENFAEVKRMGSFAVKRLSEKYGTQYSVGNAFETVGVLVPGASTGWVKKVYKIPYVATMELRDTGKYGFALPSNQILPTCIETMDCMYSFLSQYQEKEPESIPRAVISNDGSMSSYFKSGFCYYIFLLACLYMFIKVK